MLLKEKVSAQDRKTKVSDKYSRKEMCLPRRTEVRELETKTGDRG